MTGHSRAALQVPYGKGKLKKQKKRLFHLKSISYYIFKQSSSNFHSLVFVQKQKK